MTLSVSLDHSSSLFSLVLIWVNGAALVTHKGAAADAGHYIGFVKKSVFHATKSTAPASTDAAGPSMPGGMTISAPSGGAAVGIDEDDEDWYKFDDDKVSIFPKEKLGTLDGGGGLLIFVTNYADYPSQAKTPLRMCWCIRANLWRKHRCMQSSKNRLLCNIMDMACK